MLKCTQCNSILTNSFLPDGICEDCLKKNREHKEHFSKEIQIKNELASKYNLKIDIYLKAEKEIERLKSIHNLDINMDIYLNIKKTINHFLNTLLNKRVKLISYDSYGNKILDNWYNEVDYFIKNLTIDNKLIYESIIRDIIIHEVDVLDETVAKDSPYIFLFAFLITIFIIFYFKSQENKNNSEYQNRLDREKAETLRSIGNAIDEAKYREYKRNH